MRVFNLYDWHQSYSREREKFSPTLIHIRDRTVLQTVETRGSHEQAKGYDVRQSHQLFSLNASERVYRDRAARIVQGANGAEIFGELGSAPVMGALKPPQSIDMGS